MKNDDNYLNKYDLTKIKKVVLLNGYHLDYYYKYTKYFLNSINNLEELKICNCNNGIINEIIIPQSVKIIEISGENIIKIPENIINLSNLEKLIITDCYYLQEIPNNLINLKKLEIINCNKIKKIPNLINLQNLYLEENYNIQEIPYTLINLISLNIYYCKIKEIPDTLINLNELIIMYCNNIQYIPFYIHLQNLEINHCKKLSSVKLNNCNDILLFFDCMNNPYKKYEILFNQE